MQTKFNLTDDPPGQTDAKGPTYYAGIAQVRDGEWGDEYCSRYLLRQENRKYRAKNTHTHREKTSNN